MRLVLIMVSAALILASVAGAASRGGGFRLWQVDQSARTVTLAWNRQASADEHPVSRSKSTMQGPRLTFVPAPEGRLQAPTRVPDPNEGDVRLEAPAWYRRLPIRP